MIVDDESVDPSYTFNFIKAGSHIVYFLSNDEFNTLDSMFFNIKNMISISFTSLFKAQKIESTYEMFSDCYSLKSIDFSNLNIENVINMRGMFSSCQSLTSIDLSNLNTPNAKEIEFMFSQCSNIKYINIINFNNNDIKYKYIFEGISPSTEIIMNDNLYKILSY